MGQLGVSQALHRCRGRCKKAACIPASKSHLAPQQCPGGEDQTEAGDLHTGLARPQNNVFAVTSQGLRARFVAVMRLQLEQRCGSVGSAVGGHSRATCPSPASC